MSHLSSRGKDPFLTVEVRKGKVRGLPRLRFGLAEWEGLLGEAGCAHEPGELGSVAVGECADRVAVEVEYTPA